MQISSTATSSEFAAFVLCGLRVAHIKARLLQTEIDMIGAALSAGLLDGDHALDQLNEAGALHLFPELTRAST